MTQPMDQIYQPNKFKLKEIKKQNIQHQINSKINTKVKQDQNQMSNYKTKH